MRLLRWVVVAAILGWVLWAWEYELASVLVGIVAGGFAGSEIADFPIGTAAFYTLAAAIAVVCVVFLLLPFTPELLGGFLIGAGTFTVLSMVLERHRGEQRVD